MVNKAPLRQVVINIETTGFSPANGQRIIEIAAVELLDRHVSGKHFHTYLNPERTLDPGAQAAHGLSVEFLQDEPKFSDMAQEFTEFIQGAGLVAYNAPFDLAFLNNELSLLGLAPIEDLSSEVVDALLIAREKRPGKPNSLAALSAAYEINVAEGNLRGTLLAAYMLAEVYLAMTRRLPQGSRIIEFIKKPVR